MKKKIMINKNNSKPSIEKWLQEAKSEEFSLQEGMYLIHNGVVRETTKIKVRNGIDDKTLVTGMEFSYDAKKVELAISQVYKMSGIFHIRVWLNEGNLNVGDDIMYVLIGGDIRPNVINALEFLVDKIKTQCVTEVEKYD